jgi:hypothetical protein
MNVRAQSGPVKWPIPDEADLGPKMLALRERERAFVWHLVCNGGDGSKAAVAAGYSNASEAAKVRAHELRQKPKIVEAIHECGWRLLGSIGGSAIHALEQLVLRPEHPDHFKAVTAVLSRIGFSEKTALEVHHSGSIDLNHTDAALEALVYLRSMSVPREKLVEQFGHSGLARYERMLEERDRGVKVIEHEP